MPIVSGPGHTSVCHLDSIMHREQECHSTCFCQALPEPPLLLPGWPLHPATPPNRHTHPTDTPTAPHLSSLLLQLVPQLEGPP